MTNLLHIVALSGGKDSTATALRLAEVEPREYIYVTTPTGDERVGVLPHFDRLEQLLGQPIIRLAHPLGLRGLIRRDKTLPNFRMRFCTRILKAEPYVDWLEQHTPCISYVGLRADEQDRVGFKRLGIAGVEIDYPLRRWGWGVQQVYGYLANRNVVIPKRTDCKRCFHQRLIEWWELWQFDAEGWVEAEEDEALTGFTFRTAGRDEWPVALADLRKEFERGRKPPDTRDRPGMCQLCML
jgi:hypothetical protein